MTSSTSAVRRKAKGFDLRRFAAALWPFGWSERLNALNWTKRYNAFVKERCLKFYTSRAVAYQHICPIGPICLFEFGVFKGEGLNLWASINKNAGSQFHGFDSGEGMRKEEGPFDEGCFALAEDERPTFDDHRITMHWGWFEETLPQFNGWSDPEQTLVVSMDADQYGPTGYVLTMIDVYLRPGTIILFDQASVAECEFRALLDWASMYRRQYEVIAGWEYGGRVEGIAIKITE